ncbi:MAG: cysteine desulfurase [Actinobacteria bacterium]|nr:cysteine desulfurase [Actinomycetota bacterium]
MKVTRHIYLDYNATTPLCSEVANVLDRCNRLIFANPSSPYEIAKKTRLEIEKARDQVAKLINCDKNEIYFTSGGTESNNLAIKGYLDYLRNLLYKQSIMARNKRANLHLITSQIEHLSILNVFRYIEKNYKDNYQCMVSYLPVDGSGFVDKGEFRSAIGKDTVLISIMLANNEIGSIQPIEELVKIAKSLNENIIFHCDAVQGLGKMEIDVKKLGVDLLSLSSHKIHGPKGVGALYVRNGVKLFPILHGGHQEKGLRPGTENVCSIIAFGYACEIVRKNLKRNIDIMAKLKEFLKEKLIEELSGMVDLRINSPDKKCLPNTLNVCFNGVDSELLISYLSREGIYVSSGSACTSGLIEPSHVLLAMGIEPELAKNAIRFSLGVENTERDLEEVVKKIKEIIVKNKLN